MFFKYLYKCRNHVNTKKWYFCWDTVYIKCCCVNENLKINNCPVITDADDSHGSKAFSGVCVSASMIKTYDPKVKVKVCILYSATYDDERDQ